MAKKQISVNYEQQHRRNIAKYSADVEALFNEAIDQLSVTASRLKLKPGRFDLKKYPAFNNQVNEVLLHLSAKINIALVKGIVKEWKLADLKHDSFFKQYLTGRDKKAPEQLKKVLFGRNDEALQTFLKRKVKGLNLSQRVWRNVNRYKVELEAGLAHGIAQGLPAAKMATDLKQHLQNPDALFRRVRSSDGKLQLSKAAMNYNPGQGVYRSAYKNALRLTRTEINMSYRRSDMERYASTPFIVGYQVQLSSAHRTFDICDHLQGNYPKSFVFTGWHPQCMCFSTPVMCSDEEFDRLENMILNGDDLKGFQGKENIKALPGNFKQWFADNKERVAGWRSTPYFLKDNAGMIKKLQQAA